MWYTSLRNQTYSPSVPWPSNDRNVVECVLQLDESLPVQWMTDGLMQHATAVLDVHLTLVDVDVHDASQRFAAGELTLPVTIPLSQWHVLRNTCPNGACDNTSNDDVQHDVTLYTAIDLSKYVDVDVPTPNPVRYPSKALQRQIATKGIAGMSLHSLGSTGTTISLQETHGVTITSSSSMMQSVTPNTNCLPDLHPDLHSEACHGTSTYAAGQMPSTSTSTPCTDAFAGTPCIKMYKNDAPLRVLMFGTVAPQHTYNAAQHTWSSPSSNSSETEQQQQQQYVWYARVGAVSGIRVPNATPCFPYDGCMQFADAAAWEAQAGEEPDSDRWLLWIALASVIVLVTVGLWLHARHRHQLHAAHRVLRDVQHMRAQAEMMAAGRPG